PVGGGRQDELVGAGNRGFGGGEHVGGGPGAGDGFAAVGEELSVVEAAGGAAEVAVGGVGLDLAAEVAAGPPYDVADDHGG
ncbi:hypothetical protein DCD76_18680, partial [Acinetobacter baumannii]